MSNRIAIMDQDAELVNGGVLRWKGGVVFPEDNPDAKYSFDDFVACQQWLTANWDTVQDESCLVALEAAGLVKRI